jgi:hypothetical protein
MREWYDAARDEHGRLSIRVPRSDPDALKEELRKADIKGITAWAAILLLQDRVAELEAICLTAQVPSAKVNGSRSQPASLKRRTRADRVPFGWRLDPRDGKRLVPDRDEQTTIRRAQFLAAAGHSLRETCRQLDKEGRGRRGKKWEGSHSVLAGILRRAV